MSENTYAWVHAIGEHLIESVEVSFGGVPVAKNFKCRCCGQKVHHDIGMIDNRESLKYNMCDVCLRKRGLKPVSCNSVWLDIWQKLTSKPSNIDIMQNNMLKNTKLSDINIITIK